jgi:hypothetical protein
MKCSHLINLLRAKREAPQGLKPNVVLTLNVGAEAPTP